MKALTPLSGLVGDIELNKQLLRDFIIHSLDMKPGFVNRFVSLNYYPVSLHVCVSLSLHVLTSDSIQLIISLLNTITMGAGWRNAVKTQPSKSVTHVKHLKHLNNKQYSTIGRRLHHQCAVYLRCPTWKRIFHLFGIITIVDRSIWCLLSLVLFLVLMAIKNDSMCS